LPTAAVAALFEGHAELRVVVDAVLEGRLGSAAVDGDPPRAARLTLGCYALFGGEPGSPTARRLVETVVAPRELVCGNDAAWRRLILDRHGERVRDRPMRTFDPSRLDAAFLERLASALPAGFELQRLDASLAAQLDAELEPHALQTFPDAKAFAARGIGYGAVIAGRLACAATSYAVSSRSVEVAIATRPAFRGRGLAAAVSAALLRHCLEEGLAPQWSASNPVSQRLAQRLGFQPGGVCEVLYLAGA
jgi:GNAT superfamily N-acetyltransferase